MAAYQVPDQPKLHETLFRNKTYQQNSPLKKTKQNKQKPTNPLRKPTQMVNTMQPSWWSFPNTHEALAWIPQCCVKEGTLVHGALRIAMKKEVESSVAFLMNEVSVVCCCCCFGVRLNQSLMCSTSVAALTRFHFVFIFSCRV